MNWASYEKGKNYNKFYMGKISIKFCNFKIQLILKFHYRNYSRYSQPAITRSKLTVKTLEQGVKYVQS